MHHHHQIGVHFYLILQLQKLRKIELEKFLFEQSAVIADGAFIKCPDEERKQNRR